jgi:flagellar assembly protein FliH
MSLSEPVVRPLPLPELGRSAVASGPRDAGRGAVSEGQRIASAIIAQAMEQARGIQAAAEAEGRERGYRKALAEEAQALRDAGAALAEAGARLDVARRELHVQLEAALPLLCVSVAERILRRELSVRPETLAHMIRDAIAAVSPAARLTLRLHPEDAAVLERHRDLLGSALGGAVLAVEPTSGVERGGCRIETEALTLGAGLPEQLERALALLDVPDL